MHQVIGDQREHVERREKWVLQDLMEIQARMDLLERQENQAEMEMMV